MIEYRIKDYPGKFKGQAFDYSYVEISHRERRKVLEAELAKIDQEQASIAEKIAEEMGLRLTKPQILLDEEGCIVGVKGV